MTMNEYLRKQREDRNLTLEEISDKTGIPASTISSWERGAALPKGKNLNKICGFYGLDPRTLKSNREIEGSPRVSETGLRKIPVVSWTTAGAAKDFQDLTTQIDEMVDSSTRDPNAFAIEVVGDSMEPEVFAGDRVVLEPNREATNGDMAYVRFTDEAGGRRSSSAAIARSSSRSGTISRAFGAIRRLCGRRK
jgi:repressor LexA